MLIIRNLNLISIQSWTYLQIKTDLLLSRFVIRNFYFIFPAVVAISTIASFNRMKQITDDISLVVKAMKMSSMLEVGLLVLLCLSCIIIFNISLR